MYVAWPLKGRCGYITKDSHFFARHHGQGFVTSFCDSAYKDGRQLHGEWDGSSVSYCAACWVGVIHTNVVTVNCYAENENFWGLETEKRGNKRKMTLKTKDLVRLRLRRRALRSRQRRSWAMGGYRCQNRSGRKMLRVKVPTKAKKAGLIKFRRHIEEGQPSVVVGDLLWYCWRDRLVVNAWATSSGGVP